MSSRLGKLRKREERTFAKIRKRLLRGLADAANTEARLAKLRGITDEEWQAAVEEGGEPLAEAEKARDWEGVVSLMTPVQKMVHLAFRQTIDEEESIRAQLLKERRTAYEAELTAQAARAGCNRKGMLREGPELTALNDMSKADAVSIVNTYNYDLAQAILAIAAEVPTANRWVYANRLKDWEAARRVWKDAQIAQYTVNSARASAQSDFYKFNQNIIGTAILEPRTAICPVCQGLIDRGEVPISVATANPPPYHTNCPHIWNTNPERVAKDECANLWMG